LKNNIDLRLRDKKGKTIFHYQAKYGLMQFVIDKIKSLEDLGMNLVDGLN